MRWMPEPYADTLATVAAGRTALVDRLRTIAARVEGLPLDAAAEVLVLLEPAVAALEREAALALERAPMGAQCRGGFGAQMTAIMWRARRVLRFRGARRSRVTCSAGA
jgi:hypothetical protein